MEKINKTNLIKQIIETAYTAASSCYGVVALVRSDSLTNRDFSSLSSEEAHKGINVRRLPGGKFDVDIFIALSMEVKLTEAIFECQKVVKYQLNKRFNNNCNKVNVYATSVK